MLIAELSYHDGKRYHPLLSFVPKAQPVSSGRRAAARRNRLQVPVATAFEVAALIALFPWDSLSWKWRYLKATKGMRALAS